MQPLGWGAPQAANGVGGTWQPCGMDGVETAQVDPQELSELAARALRVLLGAEHWLPLSCLRLAVLGSTHDSRRCAGSVLGLRRSPRRSNTPVVAWPPLGPPAASPVPALPACPSQQVPAGAGRRVTVRPGPSTAPGLRPAGGAVGEPSGRTLLRALHAACPPILAALSCLPSNRLCTLLVNMEAACLQLL